MIGAAIAVIIGVGTHLYKVIQDNTPEAKLKKLQEQTEDLESAASEADSAWQSVNETLNGLDDAYNNIQNLEKGTYEWQVAVNKLNSSLRDIIDTFDLIYGSDYGIDEDGRYYLTNDGKKNAAEKAKQARIDSQIAANASNLAKDKSTKENAASDIFEGEYRDAISDLRAVVSDEFSPYFEEIKSNVLSQNYTEAIKSVEELSNSLKINGDATTQTDSYISNIIQLLGDIAENTANAGVDDYLDMASNIIAGNENLTTEDTIGIAYAVQNLIEQNADKK